MVQTGVAGGASARQAVSPSGPSTREHGSISYQPALDGVRALAVAVVLAFHGEVPGFSGGYLGVSVFFTLSGFLITSLLVREVDRTGDVAVGAFYARRARRLLPASLLCIGGIVLASMLTDWFEGVTELRRQAVGSLLQVANWVFLFGEGSYQNLFDQSVGAISPLEHFWSLAIEEQFYWLWPLAFLALTRRTSNAAARLRAVVVLTALAAVAAPLIATVWGPDAAYWATPARASEILMGALLAVVLVGRRVPGRFALLAPLALVLLAVAVATFPAASGPAYDGALPLVAIVSTTLLLGLQVEGPVRHLLGIRPLVWLGGISYGVYLFHWPVFVVLDQDRTGLDGPALFVVRIAVTLAIALASFHLLEQPIRRMGSRPRPMIRPTLVAGVAGTAAVLVVAVIVVPASDSGYWKTSDDVAEAAAIDVSDDPDVLAPIATAAPDAAPSTSPESSVAVSSTEAPPVVADPEPATTESSVPTPSTSVVPAAPPPLPELNRPVRIIVAGDSTAEATGAGIVQWAADNPALAQAEVVAAPGCGFVIGGEFYRDGWVEVPPTCAPRVEQEMPDRVRATDADVVALMTTSWDVKDRRWDDGDGMTTTSSELVERIEADFSATTDRMLDAGAESVVWIRQPIPDPLWFPKIDSQEEPDRHAVLYAAMELQTERHPGRVYVVDLPAFLSATGLDVDTEARVDGVHWTPEASTRIAEEYLGEQLIRAALHLDPR